MASLKWLESYFRFDCPLAWEKRGHAFVFHGPGLGDLVLDERDLLLMSRDEICRRLYRWWRFKELSVDANWPPSWLGWD